MPVLGLVLTPALISVLTHVLTLALTTIFLCTRVRQIPVLRHRRGPRSGGRFRVEQIS